MEPVRQPLGSHLSGSVPISIAVHVVVVLLVLIIPLTAVDPASIVIPSRIQEYMRAVPLPPPPQVALTRAPRTTPARPVDVNVAPTDAPPEIAQEVPTSSAPPVPGLPVGAGVGATDIGAIDTIGQPIVVGAPEAPRQSGPVRVADLPVPPRKIVDVRPVYTEIARQARTQGTVVLEAVLDPTGAVTQLRVVRSVPLLDQAALDAVRRWKYTPSSIGGRPVSVLMTITITFTLQQ